MQTEYRRRYGGPGDVAPIDPSEFVAPDGHFLLVHVDDQVAAMGGWRRQGPEPGDAEIKRMYVRPAFARRGLARALLTEIERTAAKAGATRLVLETGPLQPEAVALYRSSGYDDIEPYGYYAGHGSTHLAKSLSVDAPRLRS